MVVVNCKKPNGTNSMGFHPIVNSEFSLSDVTKAIASQLAKCNGLQACKKIKLDRPPKMKHLLLFSAAYVHKTPFIRFSVVKISIEERKRNNLRKRRKKNYF